MAKNVFFSFHYQDVIDFRANVVRQHWVTKPDQKEAGFIDKSIWKEAKKISILALKRLINNEIIGTSNTCVLVGTNTYQRPWVRYEIFKSIHKGNHLFAVHINGIKGKDGQTKNLGKNPFDCNGVRFNEDGSQYAFITRTDTDSKWYYWEEIDSKKYHINNYFKKEDAKNNAGKCIPLSDFFKIYKWNKHDGYNNFKYWVK
ncbi:TIR domain-containing protein [Acinetobacter radioresistens]|uniref:TIR domain-containing protein n=1 Tax=Acinetobacter radioresistens TaxID=40216 RepID=UPI002246C4A0|nr:TIR domain-containing protein [Acinetobacter radioresistens]MCX0340187.1 TIR domain-containing protein [Acinetobacter radioresistens]